MSATSLPGSQFHTTVKAVCCRWWLNDSSISSSDVKKAVQYNSWAGNLSGCDVNDQTSFNTFTQNPPHIYANLFTNCATFRYSTLHLWPSSHATTLQHTGL